MIGPLADHLWQSTLFAAGVALRALVFRRNRAHVRHWMWLAASVRFLIPFALIGAIWIAGCVAVVEPGALDTSPRLVSCISSTARRKRAPRGPRRAATLRG